MNHCLVRNVHLVPIMAVCSGTCLQYRGGIDLLASPSANQRDQSVCDSVSPEAADIPPLDVNYRVHVVS